MVSIPSPGLARWWPSFMLSGFLGVLLTGSGAISAADYFVSAKGDDGNSGASSTSGWRTIDRVNRARLTPGDRVLFEAGTTFPGNLLMTSEDAGTSNAPVTIGSYGEGRAILRAGNATGITVENAGGIVLENLVILGAGRTNNAGYGVRCDQTLTRTQRLAHLTLTNLDVQGFGVFGVLVSGQQAGFEHVRITHCQLHDNLRGGMEVAGRLAWDSPAYAHADVRVDHCQAYDNSGDPNYLKNHSGSGIVLYQVDGGVMEYCQAWNNGALCRSSGGGGVGLWTCASRRVVIQHCESFANRTSAADGGGFDIDGGSEDCVLQYNYSHDNDGPGLMVYTYAYASHRDHGSVVRFNISANDSRKGGRYAGLWLRTDGPPITGIEVHNNTIISGPWTDQAARIHAQGLEARVRNNIFVSSGTGWTLRVEAPSPQVRFENNLYWRQDGPTRIGWGDDAFLSLADWRARTTQETLHGEPTGRFADPGLAVLTAAGVGGILGHPPLHRFSPRPDSPALGAGLDLRRRFGLDPGARDLLGRPLLDRFPIGAIAPPAVE